MPPLDRHCLGEALDSVLGGAIDGTIDAAHVPHLAGDVDERTGPAGCDQPFGHCLRQEVRTPQVGRHHDVEVGRIGFRCRAMATGSRTVYQNIEGPLLAYDFGSSCNVGDIEHDPLGLRAALRQGLYRLAEALASARRQDDLRASFRKRGGRSKPDPGRCPGDKRPPPVEPHRRNVRQRRHSAASLGSAAVP